MDSCQGSQALNFAKLGQVEGPSDGGMRHMWGSSSGLEQDWGGLRMVVLRDKGICVLLAWGSGENSSTKNLPLLRVNGKQAGFYRFAAFVSGLGSHSRRVGVATNDPEHECTDDAYTSPKWHPDRHNPESSLWA